MRNFHIIEGDELSQAKPGRASAHQVATREGGEEQVTRTNYTLVDTAAALDDVCREILSASVIGVDTETTGFDPYRSRIRLLQVAVPGHKMVIDLFKVQALGHPILREALSSPDRIKVLHNAKFDLKMLLHHGGIEVRGLFDTLLAS